DEHPAVALGSAVASATAAGPVSTATMSNREPGTQDAPSVPSLPACRKVVVAQGDAPLIDDLEDGNSRLQLADGRSGFWFVHNDGSGTQTPSADRVLFPSLISPPRGRSQWALHTSGSGFKKWGALFGNFLAERACYDSSAYDGLEFWAKGFGTVHLVVWTVDIVEPYEGGFCQKDCYNGYKKRIELGPRWSSYSVPWGDLAQLRAGPKLEFDPHRVVFLGFVVGPDVPRFDVWIDDIRYVKRK
ncbi:MAG TPA: hypothetical protein VFQ61_05605, partial [Polyangiaceae bacterium]|nr:hypothetical protein [Polyangiaceae bacterium]